MAKLWGLDSEIIRLVKNNDELAQFGAPPVFDSELEFDEDTNEQAINNLDTDWNAHSLDAQGLKKDGILVTINPPGTVYLDRDTAAQFWQDLGNGIDWLENGYQAWDGLTDQQKQTQLLENFGTVLYINYRVLRFLRWFIKAILKPVWAS